MATSFVYNGETQKLKAFDKSGKLIATWPCRNDAINDGYGYRGACPPGQYRTGEEIPCDGEPPYGPWFVFLVDVNRLWLRYGRDGIGVHGGGSGLDNPFADNQGWMVTFGCFRMQNFDLQNFVRLNEPGDLFTVVQAYGDPQGSGGSTQ